MAHRPFLCAKNNLTQTHPLCHANNRVCTKKELDPVGATNNLRGLAAKIKFLDRLARNNENVNKKFFDNMWHFFNDASPDGDMKLCFA